jgi:hypothetical protein
MCVPTGLLPAQWLCGRDTKWGMPLCLFCSAANNTHTHNSEREREGESFRAFVERKLAARRLLALLFAQSWIQKTARNFPPSRVQTGFESSREGRPRVSGLKQYLCVRPTWEAANAVGSIVDIQVRQPVSKFDQLNKPRHRCKHNWPSL